MDSYSTYQAKARFSEILRRVREGKTVTITYHGDEVAEIRPTEPASLENRMHRLERSGQLRIGEQPRAWGPIVNRPGALDRFLEERD